jgi:hypothetical protein
MWHQFVEAILQSPWVGYGWRQTAVAQKIGSLLYPGDLPTDYAHSVVLDVIVWNGLPLGLVMLTTMSYWVLRSVYRISNGVQFLIVCALVPFAVHSLVEFPFAYAYFLFPVAWLLGYLAQVQKSDIQEMQKSSLRVRVAAMSAVFSYALLGMGVISEYLLAEEDFRVMRFEVRSVGQVPLGYDPPKLVLLTQLEEMLNVARWEPSRGMQPEMMERLRVANANFSWATLQTKLIVAYAINGQMAQAAHELASLRAIYGEKSYLQAVTQIQALVGKYPELENLSF